MIDVVVDTNVLVAAFRSSLGASYRLLLTIEDMEVAVRTGSPIVTFNVRDFRGSESLGIRTMRPGELLAIMGDQR